MFSNCSVSLGCSPRGRPRFWIFVRCAAVWLEPRLRAEVTYAEIMAGRVCAPGAGWLGRFRHSEVPGVKLAIDQSVLRKTWSGVAAGMFPSGSRGSSPRGQRRLPPQRQCHLGARQVSRFWKKRLQCLRPSNPGLGSASRPRRSRMWLRREACGEGPHSSGANRYRRDNTLALVAIVVATDP